MQSGESKERENVYYYSAQIYKRLFFLLSICTRKSPYDRAFFRFVRVDNKCFEMTQNNNGNGVCSHTLPCLVRSIPILECQYFCKLINPYTLIHDITIGNYRFNACPARKPVSLNRFNKKK